MKQSHDSYPKGAGFGSIGQAVNVDFVTKHGSRAQRRQLLRHLEREMTARKAAEKRKKQGKKGETK
jgi:hypothetical protein